MSEMVGAGSKYTDDQRIDAAIMYAEKGSFAAVMRQTDIPKPTLHGWSKSEWWVSTVEQVRTENKERNIARYDDLMTRAYNQCKDKLGEASARDAMIIMATAQDKARILQSLPNQYQGKAEGMQALAEQFRELSRQWDEKQVGVVAIQDKD